MGEDIIADRQHNDEDGLEAGRSVTWLTSSLGCDTAGATTDFFLPPFPPPKGLPIGPTSMHAVKEAAAHCLGEDGRPRGGKSYFFVLLEEDRWYSVSLCRRKHSLMLAKAAFMASGYRRDGDSRQQVLTAMG